MAATVAFMPLTRYCFVCTPFLHSLDSLYICQATQSFQGSVDEVATIFQRHISDVIHDQEERKFIDSNKFCAHYQHPPANRTSAVVNGVQWTEQTKTLLFQQTTHVKDNPSYKPLSEDAAKGVYLVELYYFNCFHFLTGVVEANIRHDGSVEHPMWCYIGHNRMARNAYDNVNTLFINYAPEVTEFIYKRQSIGNKAEDPAGTNAAVEAV